MSCKLKLVILIMLSTTSSSKYQIIVLESLADVQGLWQSACDEDCASRYMVLNKGTCTVLKLVHNYY